MTLSKLEEFFFSIRVVASWIKLLVIMHAGKISAKKKIFLDKTWVLTLASCFWNSQEGHLITDYQKIYPRSEIKINTKNHGKKAILIFQRVNFVFKIQDTQRTSSIEWRVLGLWPKKLEFQNNNNNNNNTDISLISFQQLDFEIDMIFEIWELIPEQERLSNKRAPIEFAKSWQKWRQYFSMLLEKLSSWGQYSGPEKKKNKQYSYHLGKMKKKWLNDEFVKLRTMVLKGR